MHDIGAYALRCAFVVALYAVSMALLGVRLGRQEMVSTRATRDSIICTNRPRIL